MGMRRKFIIWGFLVLILSIVVGMVTHYFVRPYLPAEKTLQKGDAQVKDETGEEIVYPFAGWKDKVRERALAIVIDNAERARPQSGLERADVVIEVPVEGGMTRFVALICSNDMDLVGPIRSARPYFMDLAQEYNGILVHAGGSPETMNILEKEKFAHLDEIYGGKQVAASFWRTPDRPKPHNLFATSDTLRRAAKNLKLNLTTLPHQPTVLAADAEVPGEVVDNISIFYANKSCSALFSFNKEQRVFERFTGEKPHLSSLGEQLKTANVIVQFVPYCIADGDGRLQLILHGKEEALIFRDGKVVKGYWEKKPGKITKFTDRAGKAISFMEGPIWIEVVPKGTRVDY